MEIVLDSEQKIISISENNFSEDNSKEIETFLKENILINIEFDIVQGCTVLFFAEPTKKNNPFSIVINNKIYTFDVIANDTNKLVIIVYENEDVIFHICYYNDNNVSSYLVDFVDGEIDMNFPALLSSETFPNILGAIKYCIMYYLAQ